MQYVYIIQEREFIRLEEPTFKIGKTAKENSYDRISKYPKGSTLMMLLPVRNCHKTEDEIMNVFCKKYIQKRDYGKEYFEGDIDSMVEDVINIARFVNLKESTVKTNKADAYTKIEPKETEGDGKTHNTREEIDESENEEELEAFDPSIHKQCVRCLVSKPKGSFGKYNRSKDGLRSCCKACKSAEDNERYLRTREYHGKQLVRQKVEDIIGDIPTDPDELEELSQKISDLANDLRV